MKAEFRKCPNSNIVIGPKHDYRGAHVTLAYRGNTLIGTIADVQRNEVLGVWVATVKHFCGDAWPVQPRLGALEILERTYEQQAA